jgi:hypothetical protein
VHEAAIQLEAVLREIHPSRPGVLSVLEAGDLLVITETFERPFARTQVEELAQLEHHDDDTWTLHVRSPEGEWEVFFDIAEHQPFDVILSELRDDSSGYFWG